MREDSSTGKIKEEERFFLFIYKVTRNNVDLLEPMQKNITVVYVCLFFFLEYEIVCI